MQEYDKNCTLIIASDSKANSPSTAELQKKLEGSNDDVKIQGLQEALLGIIQGEGHSRLLMTVIRFIVPSQNHKIKKLVQLYFEIVDKCKSDGALKEEMILVCNALRNDLMSANEFVRGSTLRLLCKIRHFKLLEPLIEAILKNLSHRHSYVRRNAVICVHSIVKSFGIDTIPHATEEIEKLLLVETDVSTKRNAFIMLMQSNLTKAIEYALSIEDSVASMEDVFQLALLELLHIVYKKKPEKKMALLRIILNIVRSSSAAVAYEGAYAILCLTSNRTAVRTAAQALLKILLKLPDNNVKLIVLDTLSGMLKNHKHILEEFVIDILRALACPSLEVRRKTIDISLQLVYSKTVMDVMNVYKKELIRAMDFDQQNLSGIIEYRRMLIRAVHSACGCFPEVSQSVVYLLMDYLGERDLHMTADVAMCIRSLVATHPSMRNYIMQRIIETLSDIQQSRVIRICLWILGEYCEDIELAQSLITCLYDTLLPIPTEWTEDESIGKNNSKFSLPETSVNAIGGNVGDENQKSAKVTSRVIILEDGTYGTEDIYETAVNSNNNNNYNSKNFSTGNNNYVLRSLVFGGDALITSMICVTLTKLVMKKLKNSQTNEIFELSNVYKYKSAYLVSSLYKHVRNHPTGGKNSDSTVRIAQCLKIILACLVGNKKKALALRDRWLPYGHAALAKVLDIETANYEASMNTIEDNNSFSKHSPDELIVFRQLRGIFPSSMDICNLNNGTDANISHGAFSSSMRFDFFSKDENENDSEVFQQRLARVQQMTGLADSVYVEAFLKVHQFDLVVELLVINRTNEFLQNVNVELSTHGDLKIIDRPTAVNLGKGESATMRSSVKVQSTDTGVIYGYVTYEKKSACEKDYLVLNELHIDLLDFIQKCWIDELTFRTMWSEFEWENKININTTFTDVAEFLEHLMKNTNMTIVGKYAKPVTLSAEKSNDFENIKSLQNLNNLLKNSSFFAVNLYSKSIFGEDALANVSVEKLDDGKLAGSVRIRSRTQGIALTLGDRITVLQRGVAKQ